MNKFYKGGLIFSLVIVTLQVIAFQFLPSENLEVEIHKSIILLFITFTVWFLAIFRLFIPAYWVSLLVVLYAGYGFYLTFESMLSVKFVPDFIKHFLSICAGLFMALFVYLIYSDYSMRVIKMAKKLGLR